VFPLEAHLRDTADVATALFGAEGRWGAAWRRFFRLDSRSAPQFLPTLAASALLHDLGKANGDFQEAISGQLEGRQTIRHEHLSALVMVAEPVRSWLLGSHVIDVDVLTAAVLSHHVKAAPDAASQHGWAVPRGRPRTPLHLSHPAVRQVLDDVARLARIGPAPDLGGRRSWSASGEWEEVLVAGRAVARKFARALRRDPGRRALLLAVKAALVVADAAASGLVREARSIRGWIEDVLRAPDVSADEVDAQVVAPRIAQLERYSGAPFRWHSFQEAVASAPSRSLLLAGCGSGKTLAAWAWIREQARVHRAGRVVFLYPTRGTATEGFRNYVGWAPEADAALVHGAAAYDLDAMLANPSEATRGKDFTADEAEERLFALRFWHRRFFSATVDQFLAFMEHGYGATCLLPVLADAIVVVDEVHSFDRRMFRDLLEMLGSFDVPVLCMTATLPAGRVEDLVGAGLEVVSSDTTGLDISSEIRARYVLSRDATATGAFGRVIDAYHAGRRVLWVLNTVARCQAAARSLVTVVQEEDVLVYHSRFKLEDRQAAHARVVDRFRARLPHEVMPAVAVTTQVCEMSLDLDADLLVTELAPCDALIQRFGRANRHGKRGADFRGELVVVEPDTPLPYTAEELEASRRMLADLPSRDLSQAQLADALVRHAPAEPRPDDDASAFLTGGYYAVTRALRESVDHSVPAVVEADVAAVVACTRAKRPYHPLVVPAPRGVVHPEPDARLPRHLRVVVPGRAKYDAWLGLVRREDSDVA